VIRRGLALLTLAACSPAPRPTPEVMPEVAAEFGEIFNEWDEQRLLALYTAEAQKEGVSPRHFEWLRGQLGACGAPEFMWASGKRGARFSYACERGALEADFLLDEYGKIRGVSSGAVGIPTPEPLHSAAVALLASTPWSVLDKHRPFKQNLNHYTVVNLGRCELLRPWFVGRYAGLFHVQCEKGEPMILRLALHRDGTISKAEIMPAYKHYRGPLPKPAPPSDLQTPADGAG
jgi:hypothetical protein